jgi:hypothetical protein
MSNFVNTDGSALFGGLNPAGVGQALQVDGAGNLKVSGGSSGGGGRSAATILNQASAAQSASGNSADLMVGSYAELTVDVNVTSLSGTGASVQVFVDRKGADGVYYAIWQSVTISAAMAVSTTIGAGMSIAQGFGTMVRLRWVISGTGASVTFSGSMIGK